jgi:hypothetical protein
MHRERWIIALVGFVFNPFNPLNLWLKNNSTALPDHQRNQVNQRNQL